MAIVINPSDLVKYPVPHRENWSSKEESKIKGWFSAQPSGLVLDATINEVHNVSISYTTSPIEGGRVITDHATVDPDHLSVNSLISDDPGVVFGGGVIDMLTAKNQKFSDDVYQYLKLLAEESAELDIETTRGIYYNMRIQSISDDISSDTGNAANLAIEFIKIKTVSSETTESMKPVSSNDEKKVQTKKDGGATQKKSLSDVDASKVERETSVWKTSSDYFLGK